MNACRALLLLWAMAPGLASWAQPPDRVDLPFEPVATPAHRWERIAYPVLPVPDAEDVNFLVNVSSGLHDSQQKLRLDISIGSVSLESLNDPARIAAWAHFADRAPVPGSSSIGWVGVMGAWIYMFTFPWSDRPLDEAWIELQMGDQRYWYEVPYGFVGDPNAPQGSDQRAEPQYAPALRDLPEADVLVPWLYVAYPNIDIQNGWKLSLKVHNSFDAEVEAVLYQDPGGVGGSMQPWSLFEPRLGMAIALRGGRVLEGREFQIRLAESLTRSDFFRFRQRVGGRRNWGRLQVSVDDETYEWQIPSSLFRYVHGNVDWYRSAEYPEIGER